MLSNLNEIKTQLQNTSLVKKKKKYNESILIMSITSEDQYYTMNNRITYSQDVHRLAREVRHKHVLEI